MQLSRSFGPTLGFDIVGARISVCLLAVALRVGGAPDLGIELFGTQFRGFLRNDAVAFEQLLLLGRVRQRARIVSGRLTLVRLFLQRRTAQGELLLLLGDGLIGQSLLLLGRLVLLRFLNGRCTTGIRLGDGGVLRDLRRLGATPILQVAALVFDGGDLERVDDQALVVHRVRGFLLHLGREGSTILDDLLDCQRTDDGAQRSGEDLCAVGLDLVLLVEEALRGLAHVPLGAADLDLGDTVQAQCDAVHRDSVDGHSDLA